MKASARRHERAVEAKPEVTTSSFWKTASSGTVTGFALPHVLVEIVAAHQAGEPERARRLYESALPLLLFEAQPVVGLALRKEILRRRGAIATAAVRQPAPTLDEHSLAALGDLLGAIDVETRA